MVSKRDANTRLYIWLVSDSKHNDIRRNSMVFECFIQIALAFIIGYLIGKYRGDGDGYA